MGAFKDWVTVSTDGASARAIATRLNRSNAAVSDWLKSERMPAEEVIRLARVYDAELLTGLLAGGIVTLDDVRRALPSAIVHAPTALLIDELHARSHSWEQSATAKTIEALRRQADDGQRSGTRG